MAYGQGMLLDSIRNVLARRQQNRAQDDQYNLAQDRGENMLERLKMQADMSSAKRTAEGENDLLKEYIRQQTQWGVADRNQEGRKYGADAGIKKAEVTGEGFVKSARVKNEGILGAQGLRNQGNMDLQGERDRLARDLLESKNKHDTAQSFLDNEADKDIARIRARAVQAGHEASAARWGAFHGNDVLKSLLREKEASQKAVGLAIQAAPEIFNSAKYSGAQERVDPKIQDMIDELKARADESAKAVDDYLKANPNAAQSGSVSGSSVQSGGASTAKPANDDGFGVIR